jgi:hypothetical protein
MSASLGEDQMQPEISEFSYGFALTNELVGWAELSAAPVFPSLIEEGRAGGGYDVKLDRPGAPLYLQFKRSEYMSRRSAKEFRSVRDQGALISVPFYRFAITEAAKSDQHELLLALDHSPNHVFYVAPRFHRISEINRAWNASRVADRSVFVSPAEIGSLDDERHTVAFDQNGSWICSDPRQIETLSSRQVLEKLQASLRADPRPLGERLPSLVGELLDAERRGREQIVEKRRQAEREAEARQDARLTPMVDTAQERVSGYAARASPIEARRRRLEAPEPAPPAMREPRPLSPETSALREAADIAARVFDAQLVIVQPAD